MERHEMIAKDEDGCGICGDRPEYIIRAQVGWLLKLCSECAGTIRFALEEDGG